MTDQLIVLIGVLLIITGLIIAFLSIIIPSRRAGSIQGRGGAVIIIGPFPIIFGTDKGAARSLLYLAIILVIVVIALFLLQIF